MRHSTTGNLKQACVKTLTASELYQRKNFNGVKELQSIFGYESHQKQALFSIFDGDDEIAAMLDWQVNKMAAARVKYRLCFEMNTILKQAAPGDNIVIGVGFDEKVHCIIFKMSHCAWQGKMTNWTRYC